ncbi:MAG: hypothetical protein A2Y70_05200 [Candidatus Aminicenantes bacterium RBG_13_64_14]|nr:MAG: hypothetical protein A2Y70_05200 [Candidatus Aminicenantes bacterium RBG_13_64_14]
MKASRARLIVALFFSASLSFPAGGPVDDFERSIPKKIGAWQASGKDQLYNRETLYDYMDGGAEVYLAFDFRQVWVRKYAGPGGGGLTLDIYDMGSPGEAFGIFSCDREDPGAGIGQGSEYGFGLLRFHQGRFFVTVMTADEDEASGKAVLDVGRAAVKALGSPGPGPDIVGFLPRESLRPDRTSYFHGNVNLNNRYFVASENILGLDRSTDCAFAEYETASDKPGYLLLVRYAGAERAIAARRSFLSSYAPEAGPEGLAQTENKKWVSAVVRDRYLIIVFESPSPDWARKLGSSVGLPAK